MRRWSITWTSLILIAGLQTACADIERREQIYRWGVYEDVVYDMYATPEGADPSLQISRLGDDIAETLDKGKNVPPGAHAHLGYMYSQIGNLDAAYAEFALEKEKFPESEVFMDRILARIEGDEK